MAQHKDTLVEQRGGGVPIGIRRVAKVFGEDTDNPFRALQEVTVDIEAGEFVSVVGPSGCGKSTLMLMVAGLLKRSRGDITIAGQSVVEPVTEVGIAFQDHLLRRRPTVLFITHSVEEAVGLSDRILVMSPSPGEVVEEIRVDIPRPRPIVLGDVPEFAGYVDRIHRHFERLGVLHGLASAAH